MANRAAVAKQALTRGAPADDESRSSSSSLRGRRVLLVPHDQAATLPGVSQLASLRTKPLLPPGMPVWIPGDASFSEGQLGLVSPVGIHDPDLLVPIAGAHERDFHSIA